MNASFHWGWSKDGAVFFKIEWCHKIYLDNSISLNISCIYFHLRFKCLKAKQCTDKNQYFIHLLQSSTETIASSVKTWGSKYVNYWVLNIRSLSPPSGENITLRTLADKRPSNKGTNLWGLVPKVKVQYSLFYLCHSKNADVQWNQRPCIYNSALTYLQTARGWPQMHRMCTSQDIKHWIISLTELVVMSETPEFTLEDVNALNTKMLF